MINPVFEIVGLSAAFLTTSAFIPQVYKDIQRKKCRWYFFNDVYHIVHRSYSLVYLWNFNR